jgi:redox-sensitive bicupin YhaK (pirin superfamily)
VGTGVPGAVAAGAVATGAWVAADGAVAAGRLDPVLGRGAGVAAVPAGSAVPAPVAEAVDSGEDDALGAVPLCSTCAVVLPPESLPQDTDAAPRSASSSPMLRFMLVSAFLMVGRAPAVPGAPRYNVRSGGVPSHPRHGERVAPHRPRILARVSGPVAPEDTPALDASPAAAPALEVSESRIREVGGVTVRRALPRRERRTVGAWCFLDHFGPVQTGMEVGPHPHIGLQTVTWLVEGEVLHRDSLGSEQLIRPGQLNLMTAGAGVAHAEETPATYSGAIHGVQLWVALPEATRHGRPAFEHGLVVLEGAASLDGVAVRPGDLAYMSVGREQLRVGTADRARALLIGGAPFEETLLMWWNFVARTRDEIDAATAGWNRGSGWIGEVPSSSLARIPAPVPPW